MTNITNTHTKKTLVKKLNKEKTLEKLKHFTFQCFCFFTPLIVIRFHEY